jgi:hypothetical protein
VRAPTNGRRAKNGCEEMRSAITAGQRIAGNDKLRISFAQTATQVVRPKALRDAPARKKASVRTAVITARPVSGRFRRRFARCENQDGIRRHGAIPFATARPRRLAASFRWARAKAGISFRHRPSVARCEVIDGSGSTQETEIFVR